MAEQPWRLAAAASGARAAVVAKAAVATGRAAAAVAATTTPVAAVVLAVAAVVLAVAVVVLAVGSGGSGDGRHWEGNLRTRRHGRHVLMNTMAVME